jgi:hypothetical protein
MGEGRIYDFRGERYDLRKKGKIFVSKKYSNSNIEY